MDVTQVPETPATGAPESTGASAVGVAVPSTNAGAGLGLARWDLYRVLSEPIRLRLLSLVAEERLTIGELAELLGESQPNVSRHAGSLKQSGLVLVTRQGTRSLVELSPTAQKDAVVLDALESGRSLCEADGSLRRIAEVVLARDAASREYFARSREDVAAALAVPSELPSYLSALSCLLPRRALAVDVGTGDGSLLDMVAPVFTRVIALDRAPAQLELAKLRVQARGYRNVELRGGDLEALADVYGKVDVAFAVRLLHHAAKPEDLLVRMRPLLAPAGALLLLDYAAHDDETMREQADLWLGFQASELTKMATMAGFSDISVVSIPSPSKGSDAHLPWIALIARAHASADEIASATPLAQTARSATKSVSKKQRS
ncbi:MAG: methyltransferase domain-containing protein [Polyangiaceae bacterium]